MAKSYQNTNRKPRNQPLEEALVTSVVNGQLPCPIAFKIAKKLQVIPSEVGEAADELGITMVDCQLGCFMYTGVEEKVSIEEVDQTLQEKLADSMVNDRLPCAVAFKVAKELKINRRQLGEAADALGFKISGCQLGFF